MQYLIGIITILLGGFFYQKSKRDTAEARNSNLDTKQKLNPLDKEIAKNNGNLESEEQKQEELKKQIGANNAVETISNLINFFTNRK